MYRKLFSTIAAITALLILLSAVLCGCGEKAEIEKTENASASDVDAPKDAENLSDVTFSAAIAEVNGVIYATRKATKTSVDAFEVAKRDKAGDIPTCKTVPIETDDFEVVAGFCTYGDYVYYVVGRAGTDYENYYASKLYRCKTDWTDSELIAEGGPRDFVIDNGVLYFGTSAYELPDLKEVEKEYPRYVFEGIPEDQCYVQIFNDLIFFDDFSDDTSRKIYSYDGKATKLIAENATLDGGYACGYVYFSKAVDKNGGVGAELYRYNMETEEVELVHELEFIAGGDGPYFCW